jgi:ankyrin repeat protein
MRLLPTELILLVLDHLDVEGLLAILLAFPTLASLLSRRHFEKRNATGDTILHRFILLNDSVLFELLLCNRMVDPNIKGGGDFTPLTLAVSRSRTGLVQMLLERDDVDLDSQDSFGMTALHHAMIWGGTEIVRLLLAQPNVAVNAKELSGRTPLSFAMSAYQYTEVNTEAIAILLERIGIDADSRDNGGRTPLSWATEMWELDAVRMLVQRDDVDPASVDETGVTPLQYAAEREDSGYADDGLFRSLMERTGVQTITRYLLDGHAQQWHINEL